MCSSPGYHPTRWIGFISEQTQYNLLSRVPKMKVLPAAKHFSIGEMAHMSPQQDYPPHRLEGNLIMNSSPAALADAGVSVWLG